MHRRHFQPWTSELSSGRAHRNRAAPAPPPVLPPAPCRALSKALPGAAGPTGWGHRAPRERRGQDEGRRALSWGRFSQGFRPLGLMTAPRAALCPPCSALGLLLSVFPLRPCWAWVGASPALLARSRGAWASSPWVSPVSIMSSGHRVRSPPWRDVHVSSSYRARPGASLGEAAGEVGFRVLLWPCGRGPGPDCQWTPQAWARIALVIIRCGHRARTQRVPGECGLPQPSLTLPPVTRESGGPPEPDPRGMGTRRAGKGRERARWGWGAGALGGAVQRVPVLGRSSVATALPRGC